MLRLLGYCLGAICATLDFLEEDLPEWLYIQWLRLRAWESQHYRALGRLNTILLLTCGLFLRITNRWYAQGHPLASVWWVIAALIIGAVNVVYGIPYARRLLKRSYLPLRLEYNIFLRLPDLVRATGCDENGRPYWEENSATDQLFRAMG